MKKILCASLLSITTSCATLIQGQTQQVEFRKLQNDATVFVNGNTLTGDKNVLELRRDQMHRVEIKREKCQHTFYIKQATSPLFFVNLVMIIPLFWGVGMGIDAASGAINELVVPEKGYDLLCID